MRKRKLPPGVTGLAEFKEARRSRVVVRLVKSCMG